VFYTGFSGQIRRFSTLSPPLLHIFFICISDRHCASFFMTIFRAFPQHLADSADEKSGVKQAVRWFLRKRGRDSFQSCVGRIVFHAHSKDAPRNGQLLAPRNPTAAASCRELRAAASRRTPRILRIFRWRRHRRSLRRPRLALARGGTACRSSARAQLLRRAATLHRTA
jgi:hypothetical protein